jgi:hypothetical protein
MVAYELKNQASVISRGEARSGMSIQDRDNAHLRRMGKKPILKVCTEMFPFYDAMEYKSLTFLSG